MQLSLVFLFWAGTLGGSDLSKKMRIEIKRGGGMGVLPLVFSDQRLNYTGFCVFEEGGSCVYFQKKENSLFVMYCFFSKKSNLMLKLGPLTPNIG